MSTPPPSSVHVLPETFVVPANAGLPMSRVDQPVGSADCALRFDPLIASVHRATATDRAPPFISLFGKIVLPVMLLSAVERGASRLCWPLQTCRTNPDAPPRRDSNSRSDPAVLICGLTFAWQGWCQSGGTVNTAYFLRYT